MAALRNRDWGKYLMLIGGFVWFFRWALDNRYQPAYANPQSGVDYLAIIVSGLGFWLLALSLWLLHRERQLPPDRTRMVWLLGVGLAIAAAVVAGVISFATGWLDSAALDTLAEVTTIVLIAGLVIAGLSTLRPEDIPRITGWILLAATFGIFSLERGGAALVGICLAFLGYTRF